MTKKHPRIGIALGGGGARGYAHCGILKALDREGIPVSAVAGTSMGAIMGAGYAYKGSAAYLEHLIVDRFDYKKCLAFKKRSMQVDVDALAGFLDDVLGYSSVDTLKIPTKILAFDTEKMKLSLVEKGSIGRVLTGAVLWPFLNDPLKIDEHSLIDGGIVCNVPYMAINPDDVDIVLGIDVQAVPVTKKVQSLCFASKLATAFVPPILLRKHPLMTITNMIQGICAQEVDRIHLSRLHVPSLTVKPSIPSHISVFDYGEATNIIQAGDDAMSAAMPQLHSIIDQWYDAQENGNEAKIHRLRTLRFPADTVG